MNVYLELLGVLRDAGFGPRLPLFPGDADESVLARAPDGGVEILTDAAAAAGTAVLARLRRLGAAASSGDVSLALLPAAADLRVNGSRPLTVKILRPGDAISMPFAGDWLLVTRCRAVPQQVPSTLAEAMCPICGLELERCQVAACVCGRFFHLENPDGDPESEDELNCFKVDVPCHCGLAERRLDDVIVPDPASLGFGAS